MSITLKEARKKLDILEQIPNNPELILTDLFSGGIASLNFLYQVNIDGKYIMDYIKGHLVNICAFNDCAIENNNYTVSFYVPSLKVGKNREFIGDDLIVKINEDKRTYKVFTECIDDYEGVMFKEYRLEKVELSDWWKRFNDLSFKNRVHQAWDILMHDRKFFVKVCDICFWLVMTSKRRKEIQKALDRENRRARDINEYNKETYEENIERQIYYKKHAPTQIIKICIKQKEIVKYLKSIGYVEDSKISKYD